jgi:DNA polymerase elongation subunit (family B)
MHNKLLYGKDETQGIVSLEVKDDKLHIFTKTGKEIKDFNYYILYDKYLEGQTDGRLEGKNELKYYSKFSSSSELYNFEQLLKHKEIKYFKPRSGKEAAMLKDGYTYYKNLKINDLSVLSFDLETTGAKIDDNSHILIISNTFRDSTGNTTRRLFAFDDYDTPEIFIKTWCKWVRDQNPDIILGHNILGFDFPYLKQFCINQNIDSLHLGRDASKLKFGRMPSQFRKDGSQSYDYINVDCYGREIVDTMFLSMKVDISRKYESYGLKQIIKQEGLEKAERQHYDASKIRTMFTNPVEWAKIKKYAEHDADDALALFDLMAPSLFYFTQIVPMSFQNIINRATGSQINNLMIRAYLQDRQAIPVASQPEPFQGAISIGNPGIYNNVYKFDVASLYPSIILRDKVYSKDKDEHGLFLKIMQDLTNERLKNKALAKDTGDRYYKDLEQSQKIGINSGYGFLGAPGLNFNFPKGAAHVTEVGRNVLTSAIDWTKNNGFSLINADTDSVSISNGDILDAEKCLQELNEISGQGISWENDGYYSKVIVVAAKNYILFGEKTTIKGSALKATSKEKALKRYINEVIDILKRGNTGELVPHYESYIRQICNLTDITDWCSKKTITKKILDPKRTYEFRVLDAVSHVEGMQEGDKVYVFFKTDKELCAVENFSGEYSKKKLFDKLYKTVKIFESVLDISQFINYALVKNMKKLESTSIVDFENRLC